MMLTNKWRLRVSRATPTWYAVSKQFSTTVQTSRQYLAAAMTGRSGFGAKFRVHGNGEHETNVTWAAFRRTNKCIKKSTQTDSATGSSRSISMPTGSSAPARDRRFVSGMFINVTSDCVRNLALHRSPSSGLELQDETEGTVPGRVTRHHQPGADLTGPWGLREAGCLGCRSIQLERLRQHIGLLPLSMSTLETENASPKLMHWYHHSHSKSTCARH
jgi:hypothetical protein